jgi:hypothetical protein
MGRSVVVRVLAMILTLTPLAAGAPTLHEHRAVEPALFDDECPLTQLGDSWIEVGLPRVIDLVTPLPPVKIALPAAPRGSSEASFPPSGPRGPPVTG